jgi:hypothetical protein
MKVLIAVETCHKFNYNMQAVDDCMVLYRGPEMDWTTFRPPIIRETWWKDVPDSVTKKFFYGSPAPREPEADEVFLPVKDDYAHLPYKTKAICQWALDHDVTHMFKVDDDTFVYVDRLLNSIPTDPWSGRYNGGEFVAGGPGYWVNADAMRVIAQAPVNIKHEWAEDKWASSALLRANFRPHFDNRYVDLRRGSVADDTLAVCECHQHKMRELYSSRQTA